MAADRRITPAAVDGALAVLPGWTRVGERLQVSYRFGSFAAAAQFGNDLAAIAEQLQHHPEWRVAFRRVDVATTTHDAAGLTDLDLRLARAVTELATGSGGQVVAPAGLGEPARPRVSPGHFYSPIVDLEEVRADAERLFIPGLRSLPAIDLRLERQLELARSLAAFYPDADLPSAPRSDRRYCLANVYFQFGDAFVYQALLRHLRPRRVIEVGAGWSSALLLDTDERFLGKRTECTFVEPFPERLRSLLRGDDAQRIRILQDRLQDVPIEEFTRLESGDILFIDSSHVAKTGSDVLHALFEVLPALREGVWVHFHDVHANFEYPRAWIEQGKSWNEAYFLRAFLMHNRDWTIELHAAALAEVAAAELLALMPGFGQNVGGSLWLRKGPARA